MNFENVCKTIDKLAEHGAKIIIFEGGEPTLWQDGEYNFTHVLQYAKKKFLSVNFTTNGLNGFNYPADTVWVSIDGFGKNHDAVRGKGVFLNVLENIKEFKVFNRKPRLFANICINKLNCDEIPALCLYLKNIVDGITIQFYYPYENNFKLFVPLDKRIKVLNKLLKLKKLKVPISDSIGCLEDLKQNTWRCHPEALINAEPDGKINIGCYVKNRGDINCKYCGFAAHVELSRAMELNIPSILTGLKIF
jgi:MoaA/NifB/PqqE/SkfB family radical SAM enzyme